MKNALNFLFVVLVLFVFSACAKEIVAPALSTMVKVEIEEGYQIDTIITFDAVTFEETIEITKTKIDSSPAQKNLTPKIVDNLDLSDNATYRIDTIITFNPATYEETIQIVKTKIVGDNEDD